MNKYIQTFEAYSRSKKRIWDKLLKKKKRPFRSVTTKPDLSLKNPDMKIPSPYETG